MTILRNTPINRHRHRRRRPRLLCDPDRMADGMDPGGQQASAEDMVVGRGFDDVVDTALPALPDQFRAVVMLVDVDGLTYAEASTAAGHTGGHRHEPPAPRPQTHP